MVCVSVYRVHCACVCVSWHRVVHMNALLAVGDDGRNAGARGVRAGICELGGASVMAPFCCEDVRSKFGFNLSTIVVSVFFGAAIAQYASLSVLHRACCLRSDLCVHPRWRRLRLGCTLALRRAASVARWRVLRGVLS